MVAGWDAVILKLHPNHLEVLFNKLPAPRVSDCRSELELKILYF